MVDNHTGHAYIGDITHCLPARGVVVVYLLESLGPSGHSIFYVGSTRELAQRMSTHNSGSTAAASVMTGTPGLRPWRLVAFLSELILGDNVALTYQWDDRARSCAAWVEERLQEHLHRLMPSTQVRGTPAASESVSTRGAVELFAGAAQQLFSLLRSRTSLSPAEQGAFHGLRFHPLPLLSLVYAGVDRDAVVVEPWLRQNIERRRQAVAAERAAQRGHAGGAAQPASRRDRGRVDHFP